MKRLLLAFALVACSVSLGAQENAPLAGGVQHRIGCAGIIHNWGFVGDSLCSGELETIEDASGKKGFHDLYEYSWGQRMCSFLGVKGDNYSQGGETARGWIKHFWDEPKNRNGNIDAKADPKQAYIIALMANDSKRVPVGDVTADVHLEDYRLNNPETFAGNYAGIIQRLRSIQPDAKFFLVTAPNDRKKPEFVEAIREIAKLFPNTYLIDLDRYGEDYTDPAFRAKYFTGGHMNARGYEYAAWQFINYIDWIIEQNPADFAEAGLIGRNLTFEGGKKLTSLPAKPDVETTDYEEFKRQYRLNKAEWDAAFEFLSRTDLDTLALGRYDLTPAGTYAKISDQKLRGEKKAEVKYERHRKYVDIQYLLDGEEIIYLTDIDSVSDLKTPYNPDKDAEFYSKASSEKAVKMSKDTFIVAFPSQPHRGGFSPDGKSATARKIVVKVRYSE